MAAARFYSSTSGSIDLTASVAAGDTSISVSTTTGLPGTTPFTLVLDPGTATEEIVTATNVSGTTITVTRGVDGSSATSHSAGVGNVRHMATARDFREPQEHIGATSNVHGIGSTGSVVGTDTAQTLTNKTAQAAAAGVQGLIVKGAASQTASYLEVQDSSGAMVWKVTPDAGGTVQTAGATAVVNASGPANLLGYVAKFTAAAVGGVAAIFKRSASGSTADIVQIQSETGTVLAKFDSAGRLTAPNFSSSLNAKVSTSVGSIVAETALVNAPAVTGDGVKRFQITGNIYGITGSSGDTYELRIKDSTAGTQLTASVLNVGVSGISDGKAITFSDVPAAGSHVYQIAAARRTGSGTGSAFAAPTAPIEIVVEQIA